MASRRIDLGRFLRGACMTFVDPCCCGWLIVIRPPRGPICTRTGTLFSRCSHEDAPETRPLELSDLEKGKATPEMKAYWKNVLQGTQQEKQDD